MASSGRSEKNVKADPGKQINRWINRKGTQKDKQPLDFTSGDEDLLNLPSRLLLL